MLFVYRSAIQLIKIGNIGFTFNLSRAQGGTSSERIKVCPGRVPPQISQLSLS